MAIVLAKPSASIMLIRDGVAGLEVLMMHRARTMAFAPGAFVFPGGKVDARDGQMSLWRPCVDVSVRDRLFSYKVAAVRELYEEMGMVHTPGVRRALPDQGDLARWLRIHGKKLALSNMVPFAHWITPEGLPKRYDTHFFLAPCVGSSQEVPDGSEAISARWVSVRRLLAGWEEGKVPLMFPTRMNLMKLAQRDTVSEAMAFARKTPVAEILPVISGDGKSRTVKIAGGAGFGVATATQREMMVEAPRPRKQG